MDKNENEENINDLLDGEKELTETKYSADEQLENIHKKETEDTNRGELDTYIETDGEENSNDL